MKLVNAMLQYISIEGGEGEFFGCKKYRQVSVGGGDTIFSPHGKYILNAPLATPYRREDDACAPGDDGGVTSSPGSYGTQTWKPLACTYERGGLPDAGGRTNPEETIYRLRRVCPRKSKASGQIYPALISCALQPISAGAVERTDEFISGWPHTADGRLVRGRLRPTTKQCDYTTSVAHIYLCVVLGIICVCI